MLLSLSCHPCLEGENMDEQLFYYDLLLESFLNYPDDMDFFHSISPTSQLLKQPM
jgi:hypothetical protein